MTKHTTITWEKSLLWLIPPILRKKTHYDWLNTCLTPLHSIYEETLYKMQHTGQVIYLEKMLNEAFNPSRVYDPNYTINQKKSNHLIYIEETIKPTIQFIYLNQEYSELGIEAPLLYTHDDIVLDGHKPLYLANVSDYTKINYANFRVFIPDSLRYSKPDDKLIRRMANPTDDSPTLKELSNRIVYNSQNSIKGLAGAIDVHTVKYHDLLSFYKLAGKTYESYSYKAPTIIKVKPIDFLEEI